MNITEIGNFLLEILEKYGITGAILLVFFILFVKFGNKLVDVLALKIADGKIHLYPKSALKVRKDSSFKINRLLLEIINKLEADRAAIFEYHNGGYNLTGMPFLKIDLTALKNRVGFDEMDYREYKDLQISSIADFVTEIDKNSLYFVSDIEDLKLSFPKLYKELKADSIASAAFCTLDGVDDSIGVLMVAFKDSSKISRQKVTKELVRKTLKISTLLDYKNIK